jgi:hypothetical protein
MGRYKKGVSEHYKRKFSNMLDINENKACRGN